MHAVDVSQMNIVRHGALTGIGGTQYTTVDAVVVHFVRENSSFLVRG